MAECFVGEIRMFAGNFAPMDWHFCDGSLVNIYDYEVLFSLIGTTYGGDGQTTFALPDLRGSMPVHAGPGYGMGQKSGAETVSVLQQQMPAHTHQVSINSQAGESENPGGKTWGKWTEGLQYTAAPANTPMHPSGVGQAGNSLPHANLPPYLCVNFIISLWGIYPSQG